MNEASHPIESDGLNESLILEEREKKQFEKRNRSTVRLLILYVYDLITITNSFSKNKNVIIIFSPRIILFIKCCVFINTIY